MAVVPRRKTSKARKNKRRSHHALSEPLLLTKNGKKTTHRLVKFEEREAKQEKH